MPAVTCGRRFEARCGSLRARREQILAKLGLSRDELRNRATHYAVGGDEYDAWEQLGSIAFLLGETSA